MLRFNLHLPMLFALLQASCIAQQIPNTLKPRVLYERDLAIDPRNTRDAVGNNREGVGTLTRLGTELLLNDAVNSQIIVVDTKTFEDTKVPLDLPAFDVQIDSKTDMLFLETLRTGNDTHQRSDQTCYENLNALKERRPRWSSELFPLDQQIWWLKEHQRFIVLPSYNSHAILLDEKGAKLAEHKVKGSILGVDETEQGFNLFVFLFTNNLTLIQLNEDFSLSKSRRAS